MQACTHTHTPAHTCTLTYLHTHAHSHTHHAHMHAHTHMHVCTKMHAHMHTHVCVHTDTDTHTCTHAHTHTHTLYAQSYLNSPTASYMYYFLVSNARYSVCWQSAMERACWGHAETDATDWIFFVCGCLPFALPFSFLLYSNFSLSFSFQKKVR